MTSTQTAPPGATVAVRTRSRAGASSGARWEIAISVATPILFLGLWELAARVGWIDARFYPAPSVIAQTLWELLVSGELQRHTLASLRRVGVGFVVGGVPGVVLGLAMGLYRPVRAAIEPMVSAIYPIPKSAMVPLAMVIFGTGETSKWAIVAVGVFFPVLINTVAGVGTIDKIHHEVGKTYGASPLQKFRTIAFPGALPLIFAGIQLGIGMGLVLIAIAEMTGTTEGLGYLIWTSWSIYAVEQMYVGLIVIGILGIVLTMLLRRLERLILPWKRSG